MCKKKEKRKMNHFSKLVTSGIVIVVLELISMLALMGTFSSPRRMT